MFPRRNSTNLSLGYASLPPTSGSFGGRQPLNLVTDQKPFRTSTAHTAEIETSRSETIPQGASNVPPMPPRPRPTPESPPRDSLKQHPNRRNTYDPFSSASNLPLQSHPPNVMPMPSLPPLQSPPPKQPRWPAPGGGVGGFTYSHQYTADAYRLNAMPSPHSDSDSPHYKPTDLSGGIHANVWPLYNKISEQFDQKLLTKWKDDLDLLLIFVSITPDDPLELRSN